MYVGIVAGEASGDNLGAGLIREIRKHYPRAKFVGICGPKMQAEGAIMKYPMDKISIMGLDGLLGSLFEILSIRRKLKQFFLTNPPDLFLGIDVPDFNTGMELSLRKAGIPTVHYVSPTVWAWRSYRIHKIKKAVCHMLTLFPFEADFFRRHHIPVTFVGHPIAQQIPSRIDPIAARKSLDLRANGPVIALLPGSRSSELRKLGEVFLQTAALLHGKYSNCVFLVPFANRHTRSYFERLRRNYPQLPLILLEGRSRLAMEAADVVLLASGTAALEAALLKKPMVVAYKVSLVSYLLVKMFSNLQYYSMPNNLVSEPLIPEFIQSAVTADNLFPAVVSMLENPDRQRAIEEAFTAVHRQLQCDADKKAAAVIVAQYREHHERQCNA